MIFWLFRRRPNTGATAVAMPTSDLEDEIAPVQDFAPVARASAGELTVPTALPASGPILWQDVAYGMTPEEVRDKRADVVPATDAKRLHDGAASLLEIPHLQLSGHDYSVQFYFRHAKLTQVTIATNGNPLFTDFQMITNALRLRYGREVDFKADADSFSTGEWLSEDGTNIALVFHKEFECLNINFQYRYADAATQL